jgi:phosphate-selective porin OprO and OprP
MHIHSLGRLPQLSDTHSATPGKRFLNWALARILPVVALCCGIVSNDVAFGQESNQALFDRIAVLESEVSQLKSADSFESSDALRTASLARVSGVEPYQSRPSESLFARQSKFPTVRTTGFFQADAGWINQDSANFAAVGDVQNGADFRRARLAATGAVADNVGYMVEFDFGFPGRPSFMDVWLEVRDLPWLNNVKVGQFRHPIGLDGLTSVKELTFVERGLPFAFLPFRQIGAMTSSANEEAGTTWALSGFRFPTDAFGGQVGDNGGYGLATRLTRLIVDNGQDRVVHVGGAYSMIDPANDAVRYRSQPEFFIAETGGAAFVPTGVPSRVPPFVDTGVIATDKAHLFTAELAATSGPFHGQSEFIGAIVNRFGGSTVTFSGVSAQAAWILTGEHRPYNRKAGVLGRVVPHRNFGDCGKGAWEVAARWSVLNLNDADVRGGRLNDGTLGVNWYLNGFTKFQVNYIHAFLDSPVNGDSDADLFVARAQVDF